jgi:tyrosyl-tRNA synthetase
VALAKEITARFHSAEAADAAEQDFINRSKGGIPDDIPKSACPARRWALARCSSRPTWRIDRRSQPPDRRRRRARRRHVISDKGLKLDAGTFVLQVGKRKFARVTLS